MAVDKMHEKGKMQPYSLHSTPPLYTLTLVYLILQATPGVKQHDSQLLESSIASVLHTQQVPVRSSSGDNNDDVDTFPLGTGASQVALPVP